MKNKNKRRDELAEKRSLRQCSTGNGDLDKAISFYLRVGFEDGWDARDEELRGKIEFDERQAMCEAYAIVPVGVSMLKTAHDDLGKQIIQACVSLARWQFDQLSDKLARNQYEIDGYETMHNEMKARIAELEAEARLHNTIVTQLQRANKASLEIAVKQATAEELLENDLVRELYKALKQYCNLPSGWGMDKTLPALKPFQAAQDTK